MKRPEIKKEDGKHDLLLKSYNDSNEKKAEVDTCIKSSQVSGVEHKKEIKDDSILLIAAERVPCQAPSENVSLLFVNFTYIPSVYVSSNRCWMFISSIMGVCSQMGWINKLQYQSLMEIQIYYPRQYIKVRSK